MSQVKSTGAVSTRAADLLPVSSPQNLNQLLKIQKRKLPGSDQLPRVSTPKGASNPSVTVKRNNNIDGGNTATVIYKDPRSGATIKFEGSQSELRPGDKPTVKATASGTVPLGTGARINGAWDLPGKKGKIELEVGTDQTGKFSVSTKTNETATLAVTSPKIKVGDTPVTLGAINVPAAGKTTAGLNVGDSSLGVTTEPKKPAALTGTVPLFYIDGKPVKGTLEYTPVTGEYKVKVETPLISF